MKGILGKGSRTVIILFFLLLSVTAKGQGSSSKIDSLKGAFILEQADTVKAELLMAVAVAFMREDMPDSTIAYGRKAATWYDKGGNRYMGGISRSRVASVYQRTERYDEAISLYNQARETMEQLKDYEAIRVINSQLASIYHARGNGAAALSLYQENVDISRKNKDQESLLTSMSQLQGFYNDQNNEPEALKTGMELLELARKANNRKIMAHTYLDIGNTYYGQGKQELAIEYFKKSLPLFKAVQDTLGIAMLQ